jgi:lipoate-protein ligase A
VVRRLTGGRAVLHARELTYSVTLPDGALGSPQTTYAAISRALLLGLRRLGVPAELQGRGAGRPPVPSLAPCFREPAEGEVVARGRKLVGSAQYREGGVTLQHGSLLFADDQPLVRTLMGEPAAEQDAPAVLESFLDPIPEWEVLSGALAAGFAEVAGVAVSPSPVLPEEEERATALLTRYDDLAWTWRR